MWKVIYNLIVHCALPFFAVFSLTKRKIRANFAERLCPKPGRKGAQKVVWLHAASLGEAVIAENLINYMRKHNGLDHFLVTTNTYYARDLLRKRLGERIPVTSLPFDLPYSIRRFITGSSFGALLLVETEIWPNLVWMLNRKGVPILIVNGRISDSTLKQYRRFSFFLRHVLSSVDLVLAQSQEHADRFVSIGMDSSRVVNAGNIKYYRDVPDTDVAVPNRDRVTFGSIKEKELPIILPLVARLRESFPDLTIFIAPRELHLVTAIEEGLPGHLKRARYSACKTDVEKAVDCVVVDTVGDLMGIYRRSKAAFVGGSLAPYGGQNVLEPLFFGTPVIFGPFIDNFREISGEILDRGAGLMVRDGTELLERLGQVLRDDELRNRMGNAGGEIIARQTGVMKRTAELIMEILWKNSESSST